MTGVQTCALPIFEHSPPLRCRQRWGLPDAAENRSVESRHQWASGESDVFVTATEYGFSTTSELHSIAGGPSGAGTLVFSKPRTAPGYEVMQRIAVTATKVFSVQPTAEGDTTVSNVWRLDRTTVTEELIAGLGPDANSLAAGIVTDGLFLYVAIASKPGGAGEFDDKAIVYRIPVDQRPQGWTVGSITMTNPRLP